MLRMHSPLVLRMPLTEPVRSPATRPQHNLPKPETATDWLQSPAEQQGLKRYVETIRERIWLILAAVVITTLAAIAYVATAEEVYEGEADILISPIADEQPALAGLGLISESSDPLRTVQTAAALIESNAAAAATVDELGLESSPRKVLQDISVEPVAESNIVTVTAKAPSAKAAAELANGFAEAAIEERTTVLHGRLDSDLPALQARLDELDPGPTRDELTAQVGQLEALRAGSDPTLEIAEPATEPVSPVAPRRAASVAAGIVVGLILGLGGAFALQVLDPRLRRESQLRDRYRLPILARIPRERSPRVEPLDWQSLSAPAIEAYRTLRAILTRTRSRSGTRGSVLVTSPGPSEGKTTTAINLATSLALTGRSVILIEADLRRPSIGKALGVAPHHGVISVLIGESTLAESLVSAKGAFSQNLGLLLAEQSGVWGAELFSLPTAQELVAEAKQLADYVIVDSPPLATVVDALPLARAVDDVLFVVKLGTSHLNRIEELAELLAESDIKPAGFAVVGVPRVAQGGYYGDQPRRLMVDQQTPVGTRAG